jgi:hypothetical protein
LVARERSDWKIDLEGVNPLSDELRKIFLALDVPVYQTTDYNLADSPAEWHGHDLCLDDQP